VDSISSKSGGFSITKHHADGQPWATAFEPGTGTGV